MRSKKLLIPFNQLSLKDIDLVGGKGANLGELTTGGFPVPNGFCITTYAFGCFLSENNLQNKIKSILSELSENRIKSSAENIQQSILQASFPTQLEDKLVKKLNQDFSDDYLSVRSSATAEDSSQFSFAGQLKTFLNLRGIDAIKEKIKLCWASLYDQRVLRYCLKNKSDLLSINIGLVVQKMVPSEKSGILFTADPISGHRGHINIDAGFGLGEALVSGIISADSYRIDKDSLNILDKKISKKEKMISTSQGSQGGITTQLLDKEIQRKATLSHLEISQLCELAIKIENHYQKPQDIEWAIFKNKIYILQSRPITTLFPLPQPLNKFPKLLISWNYIQVMMDPIRPLGQSTMKCFILPPKNKNPEENRFLYSAGGRLFINFLPAMIFKPLRKTIPHLISTGIEPGFGQAITDTLNRAEFSQKSRFMEKLKTLNFIRKYFIPVIINLFFNMTFRTPEKTRQKVIRRLDTTVDSIKNQLDLPKSPTAQMKLIKYIISSASRPLIPQAVPIIAAAMASLKALESIAKKINANDLLETIKKGIEGNITTEMDLEVGDLSEMAAKEPEGEKSRAFKIRLDHFLKTYGMRGPGEIDITRDRFVENKKALFKMIEPRGNNSQQINHRAKFKQLVEEAKIAQKQFIELTAQKHGSLAKKIVKKLLTNFRSYMPFREYPKYTIIKMIWHVKQSLLMIGESLSNKNIINHQKDIYYLYFNEIEMALNNNRSLNPLIVKRKEEYEAQQKLKAPKLMTHQGEIIKTTKGIFNPNENVLTGTAVSSGIFEGIARVILNPETENLNKGEILVTVFTDPGWTPLFINAAALVMEVGGLMTHGSVVAREYGLPAVVGVENATERIETGQRIRVNGDSGVVEIIK